MLYAITFIFSGVLTAKWKMKTQLRVREVYLELFDTVSQDQLVEAEDLAEFCHKELSKYKSNAIKKQMYWDGYSGGKWRKHFKQKETNRKPVYGFPWLNRIYPQYFFISNRITNLYHLVDNVIIEIWPMQSGKKR